MAYLVRMPIPETYLFREDAYMVKMPENGEYVNTVNVPVWWKS